MKRFVMTLIALVAMVSSASSASSVAIIPQPQSVVKSTNAFVVLPSTTLVYGAEELTPLVGYLKEYLPLKYCSKEAPCRNYIALTLVDGYAKEAYKLSVSRDRVEILASDYGGAFNGVQTLLQLLPSEVYTKQMALPAVVRGCEVVDGPKFEYRGYMLDVARTFIPKEDILRYIDYIAYHKVNKLHWHLTDNDSWRIEIKSHPELTEIGGFRGGDSPIRARYGKWFEKYGGYYTQEEICEVVEYAAVRNVEVIPEIDFPGHSEALLRVHPEMLCDYKNRNLGINGNYDNRNVVCVTKESNYRIIEEILAEVCGLFPSTYLHIGGDEVSLAQWMSCPNCSAWLKRNGYTDGYKLETMFIGRVQDIIAKYGKSVGAWNEAAFGGGVNKNSLIYGYQSSKVCRDVMQMGYPTIFMPQEYFYLDMSQGVGEYGPSWGCIFDVRDTYSFDFAKEGITPEEAACVKGFEVAYWSELLLTQGGDVSLDFLDYQSFPRVCALAEVCWGKNGGGEWQEFHNRLYARHYDRMSDMGISYRITPPEVKYKDGKLEVEKIDNATIYYRSDDSNKVYKYSGAIATATPGKYAFWSEYCNAKSPEAAHSSRFEVIMPEIRLTSSMPESAKDGYDKIAEYYRKISTSRTCYAGDWILYEFEEPVECRRIEFFTGRYNVPAMIIQKGYLEISEDGENFERVADLVDGCATLVNPRPIKAARIVAEETTVGSNRIVIGSPKIYPKW